MPGSGRDSGNNPVSPSQAIRSPSDSRTGRGRKPSSRSVCDVSKCMIRLASRTPVTVAWGGSPLTWSAHSSESAGERQSQSVRNSKPRHPARPESSLKIEAELAQRQVRASQNIPPHRPARPHHQHQSVRHVPDINQIQRAYRSLPEACPGKNPAPIETAARDSGPLGLPASWGWQPPPAALAQPARRHIARPAASSGSMGPPRHSIESLHFHRLVPTCRPW